MRLQLGVGHLDWLLVQAGSSRYPSFYRVSAADAQAAQAQREANVDRTIIAEMKKNVGI